MKYFIDTEFMEGDIPVRFAGLSLPKSVVKPNNTIQLISIALVSEDNREYYAISKDFNLKEAWNRFDMKELNCPIEGTPSGYFKKVYWIRDNVLNPIFHDLLKMGSIYGDERNYYNFTYSNLKRLIRRFGKTNKQIAFEVVNFVHGFNDIGNWAGTLDEYYKGLVKTEPKDKPQFYGYYSAYDHVALCWLFGKMIDLPNGFPMLTIDLKQMLDDKVQRMDLFVLLKNAGYSKSEVQEIYEQCNKSNTIPERLPLVKKSKDYPKQTNEHSALYDARWNKQLHEFIKSL